ncbi:unnamed protein product [Microthlaspi erraticum]|uniref:Up-frameshift suppressor 2 C-terminal domain-containing protein n=1 Tax=Microthlaspi erraticum TaxID=1685480 RepID=A0A6D2KG36_9BRAS|nr:unnamed protein product [Microthlaspi erraticum]
MEQRKLELRGRPALNMTIPMSVFEVKVQVKVLVKRGNKQQTRQMLIPSDCLLVQSTKQKDITQIPTVIQSAVAGDVRSAVACSDSPSPRSAVACSDSPSPKPIRCRIRFSLAKAEPVRSSVAKVHRCRIKYPICRMAAQVPLGVWFAPSEQQIFEDFLIPKTQGNLGALVDSPILDFNIYLRETLSALCSQLSLTSQHKTFGISFLECLTRPQAQAQDLDDSFNRCRRNTVDYVTVEEKRTGWRMYEYERILDAPIFQTTVVVHLFYSLQLDQTAELV